MPNPISWLLSEEKHLSSFFQGTESRCFDFVRALKASHSNWAPQQVFLKWTFTHTWHPVALPQNEILKGSWSMKFCKLLLLKESSHFKVTSSRQKLDFILVLIRSIWLYKIPQVCRLHSQVKEHTGFQKMYNSLSSHCVTQREPMTSNPFWGLRWSCLVTAPCGQPMYAWTLDHAWYKYSEWLRHLRRYFCPPWSQEMSSLTY